MLSSLFSKWHLTACIVFVLIVSFHDQPIVTLSSFSMAPHRYVVLTGFPDISLICLCHLGLQSLFAACVYAVYGRELTLSVNIHSRKQAIYTHARTRTHTHTHAHTHTRTHTLLCRRVLTVQPPPSVVRSQ